MPVSELVSLQLRDFPDRSLSTVHIMGKGRRERVLPLWKETQFALRAWLAIRPQVQSTQIFLNANGQQLTRDGFAFRLAEHVKTAAAKQPSIHRKRVTPHVLRHSCAMHTLAATGDIRKVALWLGHASIQSTETYLRADPEEKFANPRGPRRPSHQARALQATIRCLDYDAHRRSEAGLARRRTFPQHSYYLE